MNCTTMNVIDRKQCTSNGMTICAHCLSTIPEGEEYTAETFSASGSAITNNVCRDCQVVDDAIDITGKLMLIAAVVAAFGLLALAILR